MSQNPEVIDLSPDDFVIDDNFDPSAFLPFAISRREDSDEIVIIGNESSLQLLRQQIPVLIQILTDHLSRYEES